ncbi:enoyl-CoA hydratase/isomerase family protein [Kocuria rhizosphaericola]|uniref:enoyl-CoA hydratase/isomerase family protein n=1 Tax=Kocuria rhizosphaericola TaxID=3376284 RepID=UPI003787E319
MSRSSPTAVAVPPRVRTERTGAVAVVTLDDEHRRNVLGRELRSRLRAALTELATAPEVGAVVLTGAGRCFSGGGDLAAMPPAGPAESAARMAEVAGLVQELASLEKPVVAAVNGPAAGVAVGLVCCCDVVVAGEGARFLFPFTRLGLAPDGGLVHSLVQRVGAARARRVLLEAAPVDAGAARDAGLVDHLVPDPDVLGAAIARAGELAGRAPLAVAAVKRGIREASGSLEDALAFEREHQPALFGTSDFLEGKQSFFDKRHPSFSGR